MGSVNALYFAVLVSPNHGQVLSDCSTCVFFITKFERGDLND